MSLGGNALSEMVMSEAEPNPPPNWDVFVSYRTASGRKVARRVQEVLERSAERVGRELKVFRDETSLELAGSLPDSIQEQLSRSRFLVVVLEEETARSTWVGREIDFWLANGGAPDRLLLVRGSPSLHLFWDDTVHQLISTAPLPGPLASCFLREPAWADGFDRHDDGPLLRLSAGVLGVPVEDVLQREMAAAHQRRRQSRRRTAAFAVLGAGVLAASVLAAVQAKRTATASQEREATALIGQALTDWHEDPIAALQEYARAPIIESKDFRSQVSELEYATDFIKRLVEVDGSYDPGSLKFVGSTTDVALATANHDAVDVFDSKTGNRTQHFRTRSSDSSLYFEVLDRPDDRQLVVCDSDSLRIMGSDHEIKWAYEEPPSCYEMTRTGASVVLDGRYSQEIIVIPDNGPRSIVEVASIEHRLLHQDGRFFVESGSGASVVSIDSTSGSRQEIELSVAMRIGHTEVAHQILLYPTECSKPVIMSIDSRTLKVAPIRSVPELCEPSSVWGAPKDVASDDAGNLWGIFEAWDIDGTRRQIVNERGIPTALVADDPPTEFGPYCPCQLAVVADQIVAGVGSTFWILDLAEGVVGQTRQYQANAYVTKGFLGSQQAPTLFTDESILTPYSDGYVSTDLTFDPELPAIDINGDFGVVESGGSLVAFGGAGSIANAQPGDALPLDGASIQISHSGDTIGVGVPGGVLLARLGRQYLKSRSKQAGRTEEESSNDALEAACGDASGTFEAYPGGAPGFLSGSEIRRMYREFGKIFDCKSGKPYRSALIPEDGWTNSSRTRSVELAQTILDSNSTSKIAVVNGPSRNLTTLPIAARQAAYAPDGHTLVWIDSTATRAMWAARVNETSGELAAIHRVGQGRFPNLQEIAVDPSGRFALVSRIDGVPTLIEVATGSIVGSSLGPATEKVMAEDGDTELFARILPQGLRGIRSDDRTTTWSWKLYFEAPDDSAASGREVTFEVTLTHAGEIKSPDEIRRALCDRLVPHRC